MANKKKKTADQLFDEAWKAWHEENKELKRQGNYRKKVHPDGSTSFFYFDKMFEDIADGIWVRMHKANKDDKIVEMIKDGDKSITLAGFTKTETDEIVRLFMKWKEKRDEN